MNVYKDFPEEKDAETNKAEPQGDATLKKQYMVCMHVKISYIRMGNRCDYKAGIRYH